MPCQPQLDRDRDRDRDRDSSKLKSIQNTKESPARGWPQLCSLVLAKLRDELQPCSDCIDGSSSVRLKKRPDVVEFLKNDPLCPHEESPAHGSVQISVASPEHRTERDVSTFDEQSPHERSLLMRELCSVYLPEYNQPIKIAHWGSLSRVLHWTRKA